MKLKRFAIYFSVLWLLVLTTGVVLAQSADETKMVVENGEVIRNDIALFGEALEIQEGATVAGDVALFGGNAVIAGTVTGDIVLFGGDLVAESTAVIEGDCALLGGSLDDRAETGTHCTNLDFGPNFMQAMAPLAASLNNADFSVSRPSWGRQFFVGMAETAGQTLLMALLAFGVASLVPHNLTQVEAVVRQKPVTSGVVGLLTAVAVPALIVLVAVTSAILLLVCVGILGIPLVFLLAVGLAAGMALGWITIGNLVGRWLADRLNLSNRSLPVTAVLGTTVLTFGIGLLGALPFVIGEGFLTVIIGSIGLGAAALSRFGTRAYPPGATYETVTAVEDPDKITAVLETLPVDDAAEFKEN